MATSTTAPAPSSLPPFKNTPFLDFSVPDHRRKMQAALAHVEAELGHHYDLTIGGRQLPSPQTLTSVNPARPTQIIGIHAEATPEHVDLAVSAAAQAFPDWSRRSPADRAGLLLRTAELVREHSFELCAWLSFEVGKNWAEADADVGETIDFLEFYAREALALEQTQTPIQLPGERNRLRYLPLGVGAVIPPWNFPLAIMAGMTAASIVCGNTVVLKPSPDAPTIAARFLLLLEQAGLPDGVVNLCQGAGPGFGAALVVHPRVRFVAFTGSKKVGLEIHESAARTQPGQHFIKRTILEMGGKDAIIVEPDCDLDAAADGVVASAFGFSGQKCSACSRVIVADSIYDTFLDRLRNRAEALRIGPPTENAQVGPVINLVALDRIESYLTLGRAEARLVTGGHTSRSASSESNLDSPTRPPTAGFFVQPTIFADVAADSRLAQEEIFGPVLAVLRSHNFADALAIANNSEYGLTGAVYTNSRDKLNDAATRFHVGNLYFNRKCTGAMVGAHPFGGFNMSGTDSKAGGPDYLLLFTQAKSIAEKVGVAPDPAEELTEQRMGL